MPKIRDPAMDQYSSSLWNKIAALWQNDGISETGPTNNITASQRARKKSRRRMQRESRRRNRA